MLIYPEISICRVKIKNRLMKTNRTFLTCFLMVIPLILSFPCRSQNAPLVNNAPITTAATITACPGNPVTVTVKVDNFTSIVDFTLRIEYDGSVITYDSTLNTYSPQLPSTFAGSTPIAGSNPMRKIMITWSQISPVTMTSGSNLITLGFHYVSGTTSLHFNNDVGGGQLCEYTDLNLYPPLNDIPTSTYYHDGQVSSGAVGGTVTGGSTIDYGSSTGSLILSGYLGSVLKWQSQYNGGGFADIPGTSGLSSYSEVPQYTGIWDYRAVVQNLPCSPVNSTYTTVTVITPVGTSKNWVGNNNNDWLAAKNWSPPGPPMSIENVVIPAAATFMPVVANTTSTCHNLLISKGATVTVNPGKNLNVAGTLTVEGP
jgi:hypothetical protein